MLFPYNFYIHSRKSAVPHAVLFRFQPKSKKRRPDPALKKKRECRKNAGKRPHDMKISAFFSADLAGRKRPVSVYPENSATSVTEDIPERIDPFEREGVGRDSRTSKKEEILQVNGKTLHKRQSNFKMSKGYVILGQNSGQPHCRHIGKFINLTCQAGQEPSCLPDQAKPGGEVPWFEIMSQKNIGSPTRDVCQFHCRRTKCADNMVYSYDDILQFPTKKRKGCQYGV